MSDRRSYAVYAITRHGVGLARRLCAALGDADLFASKKLAELAPEARELGLPMGPTLRETWKAYDCHVHVISVGAVVRMIAPLLENKKVDPAIVCVDDDGRFAVCLLSGHVGRGNEFTHRIADALRAVPVITTASDVRGTLTVDILGRELGWRLDDPDRNVTAGCAAVVNEERVLFVQETGESDFWPIDRELPPGVEYARSLDGVDPADWSMLLVATDRDIERSHPEHFARSVVYRPRSLVVGIGCDRGTSADLLGRGVDAVLQEAGLSSACVRAAATIDVKGDEPGLVELCHARGWPLELRPAEELDVVEGVENPSETVRRFVGTRSVGEAACLLVAGATRLLVPKAKYTEPGAGRNMTVAVARVPFAPRGAARVRAGATR
ncbi:MAG: cobalamin biosynthesis protein [Planctomycetota bacterium]